MFKKTFDSILQNITKQIADLQQLATSEIEAAAIKQERIDALTKERTAHFAEAGRATTVARNLTNLIEA